MSDLTLPGARDERNALASRTDVLDKVGVLATLPDGMHVTTDMVATFYAVDREAVASLVKRNRGEFEDDGYTVMVRSTFEERFTTNLSTQSARIALFPRRAVLRVGMLLRDSDIARQVRDYLLDTEERSPARRELTEDEIVLQALQIQGRKIEALTAKVAELEPKADLADTYLTSQGGARLVREVAKIFGWKEKDLRRWLIEERMIFAKHAPCGNVQYDFYAEFVHHFQSRETIVNHTWGTCSHYTLFILPRGVELIRKRMARPATGGDAA